MGDCWETLRDVLDQILADLCQEDREKEAGEPKPASQVVGEDAQDGRVFAEGTSREAHAALRDRNATKSDAVTLRSVTRSISANVSADGMACPALRRDTKD
jgi:hypothetical protein